MTAIAEAGSGNARPWRDHGVALAAIILLIVAAFHDALLAALDVWMVSPTYSHCFLIVPIIAWLVWEKRDILATIRPAVAPRFLLAIPFLLVLWWLGELSAINEVRQYAVVALIQVMIVALLGTQVLRVIWFPILFLSFLVPTGEYLIAPMQRFATHFTDIALNLLKIPHYTEGTTFELTNGRFEIAEACAGLRFLIATVTLGVLFSYLVFRKPHKVALFLFASVAVPLVGNGLRCVGIILLAHFTNNEYGAGADHIVYGWGFNVAILLVLIVLGSFFRDDASDTAFVARPAAGTDSFRHLALVMTIAAVLISAGPAFAWWHNSRGAEPNLAAAAGYLQTAGWREKGDGGNWSPVFPGADAQLMMTRGEPATDLYVGYYAEPRPGHAITAHLNQAWDITVWTRTANDANTEPQGRQGIRFRESAIKSNSGTRLIWSAYWTDDRFILSPMMVKLLQAKTAFGGREAQAFIALSTQIDGPIEEARARLAQGVSGLNLSQALDRAGQPVMEPARDGAR